MKKALALTLVIALLLSLVVDMGLVKNVDANPALMPEEPPPGYRIYADGSYGGENMRRDGDTYTLTGNVNCPIVIERNGIVLNGAGYTVQGNGVSAGVWLMDKSGITIKNLRIKNFKYGIEFSPNYGSREKPANCTIIANRITNNTYGMYISSSSGCYITDNYIAENTYGAAMDFSSNVFKKNAFSRNQYAISEDYYRGNDIDTSNTINGKPIYYWVNKHDMTVPSNAGMVLLKNCSGIKVQNLSLKGNGIGLMLIQTCYSTITENVISENLDGIMAYDSCNNTISGNTITNNANSGINIGSRNNRVFDNTVIGNGDGVISSEGNLISNNQITANQKAGISAGTSCNITDNYVAKNLQYGIFIRNISGCTLLGNNITLNQGEAIHFEFGPNATIKGNYVVKNKVGIWIGAAFFNNIISNNISENDDFGIKMEGPHHDNLFYHNNFINNNQGGNQAFIGKHWVYPDLFKRLGPYVTPRPPQYVDGATNIWDDGAEGNYWSDRTSATPYYINENNQDNHPLQSPHEISAFEIPTKTVAFPPPALTQPTQGTSQTQTNPTGTPNLLSAIVPASVLLVAAVIGSLLLHFRRKGHP